MHVKDLKQRSANPHDFAMVPKAEIPRSSFPIIHNLKTAFNFSDLVPIFINEVLPGDLWRVKSTVVARTSTPIVPIMDNWHIDTFYFFIPCRLLWTNWVRFMGEQDSPSDSISFAVPTCTSPVAGYAVGSVQDYMGLPTVGQVGGAATITHNNLPMRAYNLVWHQWFRDENLQNSPTLVTNDGPDTAANYVMLKRGKRPDYFTTALPFVQKGASVSIPLGSTAVVIPNPSINPPVPRFRSTPDTAFRTLRGTAGTTTIAWSGNVQTTGDMQWENSTPGAATNTALVADLSTATAATINQLRQSFQIQKLLERDARGGSRYTEIVRAHFGVISPDARLQRPEYLGGGHTPIITNAVPVTTSTGTTGATTPTGYLAATSYAHGTNGFTYGATEHGYILGLANARADLTYQQGMHKMWSRSTRYDFYFPVFAMLGEQSVLNKEIYADGSANDALTFGYQERWAEYRYMPNRITGRFKSTAASTLDFWHTAQKFASLPALNSTFITDDSQTVTQRNFALGATSLGQQILADILFSGTVARAMPTYSVPGLIDHF